MIVSTFEDLWMGRKVLVPIPEQDNPVLFQNRLIEWLIENIGACKTKWVLRNINENTLYVVLDSEEEAMAVRLMWGDRN